MRARCAGGLRFVVAACLAVSAIRSKGESRDVMSTLMTAAGRSDLQQVVQVGRADLSAMIVEQLANKAAAVREAKEGWKAQGLEAGMNYEIKLAPNVFVSVAVEDLPALSAWDGKGMPPVPFDFKAKKENEAAGKEVSVEVHFNPACQGVFGVESIQLEGKLKNAITGEGDRATVKISGSASDPVVEVDYGKGWTTPTSLKSATGLEGEIEQSIGLDSSRGTDDFYTEDMEKSDWWIVRTTENFVAKLKWGISGSVGHEKELEGGDKLTTKVKYTLGTDKIRTWWTNRLFADADEAARQLDKQLVFMGEWRRKRIDKEARKWGIDPTGKTTAQLIKEVGNARRKAGVTDPVFGPKGSGGAGGSATAVGGGGLLPPPLQGSAGSGGGSSGGGGGGGGTTLKPFR